MNNEPCTLARGVAFRFFVAYLLDRYQNCFLHQRGYYRGYESREMEGVGGGEPRRPQYCRAKSVMINGPLSAVRGSQYVPGRTWE